MNHKSKIAIYTIVNKQSIYQEFRINLSQQKNIDYQLHEISNCNGEYDSARKAFNENAVDEDADYYVFLHPDIRFNDEYALADIVKTIDGIKDFGVVGIAGARKCGKNREIVSTIVQGYQKSRVGTYINIPTPVQTVDECFFVIKREYFSHHIFSEKNGWHLYGVEYCLAALQDGKTNYAIPSRVWHMSPGSSLDERYLSQLEKILGEYKDDYDLVCTTVNAWKPKGLIPFAYRKYYWMKQKIKRHIKMLRNVGKGRRLENE